MRAIRLAPLVVLLAARGASAQSADSAAIAALEQRVETAVARGDAAFLESVYAPSFRFRHSTGMLEDRAMRMTALRRGPAPNAPRVTARTVDSLEVEVHGDVALTTGRIWVQREGSDYTVRYARVYVRRDGRWQLLTHHSTYESPGAPPPLR
jgi:ketosteroid isomerase-like protein